MPVKMAAVSSKVVWNCRFFYHKIYKILYEPSLGHTRILRLLTGLLGSPGYWTRGPRNGFEITSRFLTIIFPEFLAFLAEQLSLDLSASFKTGILPRWLFPAPATHARSDTTMLSEKWRSYKNNSTLRSCRGPLHQGLGLLLIDSSPLSLKGWHGFADHGHRLSTSEIFYALSWRTLNVSTIVRL